ncbi:bifunctional 4-hydroxy-2-oxoglutarate aldolase/2-dehydro-3-deoxy-phosphogluconate aldolase [Paenibacillus alba]|uniref:Bifunctional 4-hydroxy-2-oxoglutarate aldolase/2-dehydro-3-deoxy-phosphogluconate aldolase n=1 Tax=Paenibacillus alba TaxID=1197127 RepID=A0ABU6G315_9BACL|nr:bifunctional 4-hydroxy-2-oxoglutarate aldolase/2-dehydro-3-deoxy-phosphogluconate aldolase [Paenibacillus alba]MEC0227667.1 bifunctional 4-hydroxy-2-oxoglutarate aldolase/2-dehydro-3-deoxy-phosphogluconate aldolase [Paenibacillus alba]
MNKSVNLLKLEDSGIVAVIRRPNPQHIHHIANALVEGGVGALEITVDTPGVFEMIASLKVAFGERTLVGAGTVLNADTARMAIQAGSDFIFSPILDVDTIRVTNALGKISIPGVMTPTEIVKAYQAGADLVKVFPGNALGVDYFKELQGPLGHIPMMPTGGTTMENAAQFIRNGAVAIGIGGSLVKKDAIEAGRYEELTHTAKQFAHLIQEARK